MARMSPKSIELQLTRGTSNEGGAGFPGGEGGYEVRSVEALDRDNSRRLGDLDIRYVISWTLFSHSLFCTGKRRRCCCVVCIVTVQRLSIVAIFQSGQEPDLH